MLHDFRTVLTQSQRYVFFNPEIGLLFHLRICYVSSFVGQLYSFTNMCNWQMCLCESKINKREGDLYSGEIVVVRVPWVNNCCNYPGITEPHDLPWLQREIFLSVIGISTKPIVGFSRRIGVFCDSTTVAPNTAVLIVVPKLSELLAPIHGYVSL